MKSYSFSILNPYKEVYDEYIERIISLRHLTYYRKLQNSEKTAARKWQMRKSKKQKTTIRNEGKKRQQ